MRVMMMRTLSDPPEIELETNRVHSGINKEAHLTCRVQGNPEPIVSWYKDSNLLSESETVRFKTEEGRHTSSCLSERLKHLKNSS